MNITLFKAVLRLFFFDQKLKSVLLILLMIFSGVFDALGVASIMPFITFLSDFGAVESNFFLKYLYKILDFKDESQFLNFLGVLLLFCLILSLFVKALTTYLIFKFSLMSEYRISKRLFKNYLFKNFEWLLSRDKTNLSADILSEISQLINRALLPMLQAASQFLVILSILALLLIVDAKITLVMIGILSMSYIIIYKKFSSFLKRIGQERYEANKVRFEVVNSAFNAIKEIKLRRLEDVFINRFSVPAQIYGKNQAAAESISHLPRFLMEAIIFGGVVTLILYLQSENNEFLAIVPKLSIFALAGYKLLPALQQIYRSFSQINFSSYSAERIVSEIEDNGNFSANQNAKNLENSPFANVINLERASFRYQSESKPAMENINLELFAGEFVGLVGKSGSGKSTMVNLLLGLLEPQEGGVFVDGAEINQLKVTNWRSNVSFVPQEIYLLNMSIARNIAFEFDAEKVDMSRVMLAAKSAEIHEFITINLAEGYDTIVGENGARLSGGQKQRIGIARALYSDPKLLVLDEATSALDSETEARVLKNIHRKQSKRAVLLVTHQLRNLKKCDKIYVVSKGCVVAEGTFNTLLKSSELFRNLLKGKN